MNTNVLLEQLDLFISPQPVVIQLTDGQRTALIERLAVLLLAVVFAAGEVNHAG